MELPAGRFAATRRVQTRTCFCAKQSGVSPLYNFPMCTDGVAALVDHDGVTGAAELLGK